ncbi:ABC transporter ATP-binding protein [Pigmentiphaga soli]|uniref:ABC transporter ATP-binding protein n=1 Tax=Pigmentiphaga soli TaxID=1007095 RepID=A0ABP8H0I9_9BURK
MLRVDHIETAYGASQVLFDVSLRIEEGEVVTLLGRNGMGKTTTVNTIVGVAPPLRGSVVFEGIPIAGTPPHRIARAGIGLVPEGRQIFPNLSVRENLVATANGRGAWNLDAVFELFPALAPLQSRSGNLLSGGEQQMLAIARTLLTNPRLLILDEATEGLAPRLRGEIWRCLRALKARGQSILVIDKDVAALGRIADRHYVLEKGRVVWSGSPQALAAEPEVCRQYLGI